MFFFLLLLIFTLVLEERLESRLDVSSVSNGAHLWATSFYGDWSIAIRIMRANKCFFVLFLIIGFIATLGACDRSWWVLMLVVFSPERDDKVAYNFPGVFLILHFFSEGRLGFIKIMEYFGNIVLNVVCWRIITENCYDYY